MFITPKTNLVELEIGNTRCILDRKDAKETIKLLGTGKINKYKGYQKIVKVGHLPSPCIDITAQYKANHG